MVQVVNPALEAFLARLGQESVIGQVLLRREGEEGWELRNVQDRESSTLKKVELHDLRALAQFTAHGAFRPLKSAPNLQTGWCVAVRNAADLEAALNHLYPGMIADSFAAQQTPPPVSDYREYTNRQTGMYRITQMLSDEQAGRMIQSCCHPRFCLKQRLWTVEGLSPDKAGEKSAIPCLEPCALLLEFARKAMRIEQAVVKTASISTEDLETIRESLVYLLQHPSTDIREADFGAPLNPRRIQLVLEKYQKTFEAPQSDEK